MDFEDVVMRYEIRGVYDGVCVYELSDGTLVNRFSLPGYEDWVGRREATQAWIDKKLEERG